MSSIIKSHCLFKSLQRSWLPIMSQTCLSKRPKDKVSGLAAHPHMTISPRFYSSPPAAPSSVQQRKKLTILNINRMYKHGEPISMMTAQDYPSGLMVDRSGIDICLVGDSLAMVALGYDSTNPLTVDEMLHHCRAVARGSKSPFLIADLPSGSYEVSPEEAVRTSLRLVKEGNMEAVKLEGGKEMAGTIRRIASVGIPVMAHIGLTPQRQSALGGFRVQGKTAKQAMNLVEDALAVQEAGAFAVLLEAMPAQIGDYITQRLSIPTIGIGAGPMCSGQVLVLNDAMGIFDRFVPKFTKQYANLNQVMTSALEQYHQDVKTKQFPSPENTYPIDQAQLDKFWNAVSNSNNHDAPLKRQQIDQEKIVSAHG
ncbi:ketopantoate hydroxymethyltransferase-domain-containing protein [Absidia repens]|uniref:3-methyl-2-oxobutanoate hydroxymethyltransferase n=1 Tax=Absidia repens TaxID=90262 RepID=A0A1X2IAU0_9FUNG|nr:ketopantoate hydroxymethyltransferase-domain-containing protein [Absidia repens]